MRPVLHFVGFAILVTLADVAAAKAQVQAKHIKVAVLENLKVEKLSSDKYMDDYMDGLEVAASQAKRQGFAVEIKHFFYGKEPLAIFGKVKDVKAWRPDVVIGPRSSSYFLLLKNEFSDVLVLSPFATASSVAALPDNFYSLTLPNEYFTQAVINLVVERFRAKSVAPIGEINCKNCMDFIKEFRDKARQLSVTVKPEVTFLTENSETQNVTELLTHYRPGDIILLPNTSYASGNLVARISDAVKDPNLTFVGGDGWGDWSASYVGKVKSTSPYTAIRLSPWSFDSTDQRTKDFVVIFKAVKGLAPTGVSSLFSYATLSSVIQALQAYPGDAKEMRRQILLSYRAAHTADKNYARPTSYSVYKITQAGESFSGEISALK